MQMTLETAQSLSRTLARHAFGPPTRQLLHNPVASFYFAAASLEDLASYCEGAERIPFTIKAYIAGTEHSASLCECVHAITAAEEA